MSINWDELENYKPPRNFMYYFRTYVTRPLSTAKYWLVSHTIRKYHLIDIRNTEYKWGWVDSDAQILYACFGIFKTFIEKEVKPSFYHQLVLEVPEGEDEDTLEYWKDRVKNDLELQELYDWWTIHRPAVHKSFEDGRYDFKAQQALDDKDNEMLKRLMDVRQTLWT